MTVYEMTSLKNRMARKFQINSCVAIVVSVFLIIVGYSYLIDSCFCPRNEVIKIHNYSGTEPKYYVEAILEMTRIMIKVEMWKYNFTHSGVSELKDLVPESGGIPIRSVIVSTWRSGSSFLGDLINSVPSGFHSYEPLMMFGIYTQIRGPPHAASAAKVLKDLMKCNFSNNTDLHKYLAFAKNNLKSVNQFSHNKRFWDKCTHKIELCFDADFNTKFCELFPFQSIKLDRLRLPLVRDLLDDGGLNVKVVLLVRDPRGVMQSRRQIKNFCSPKQIPDCAEAGLVCSDMITDYEAAVKFLKEYPERFMVLRYEDLAFNLRKVTQQLLRFLRLEPTPSVYDFLKTHTTASSSRHYSTFRITKNIPYKWRKAFKFSAVQEIQEKCKKAMSLWGYELAQNASHMASKNFNPLLPLSIKHIT